MLLKRYYTVSVTAALAIIVGAILSSTILPRWVIFVSLTILWLWLIWAVIVIHRAGRDNQRDRS